MIFSLLYVILALFGLGLLVFIHELGHYWMARRVGMTVEAFSIGFGKPIYVWENDGVKWQICYLPFGGFVRIAGMEKKGILEPYQIPDGFYGKRPAQRIKVALMGPIVNIAFALLAFCILWSFGGREKPFSEFTHLVGWVTPALIFIKQVFVPAISCKSSIIIHSRIIKTFSTLLSSMISPRKFPAQKSITSKMRKLHLIFNFLSRKDLLSSTAS